MFKDGDKLNEDHIIPTYKGGRDTYDNLQLLHKHCHDKKSALDIGMYDKHQSIEERYEGKVCAVKRIKPIANQVSWSSG